MTSYKIETVIKAIYENPVIKPGITAILKSDEQLPSYGSTIIPLSHPVQNMLEKNGITNLFSHQVNAINSLRDHKDAVLVTGTASGKTLSYAVPIFESIVNDSKSRALIIYPTKALAADQKETFSNLIRGFSDSTVIVETCDGDTSIAKRKKAREKANIVLTNPDFLSGSILPANSSWADFIKNLKYIVIDEVHTYRGNFGSHLANIIRRFIRICAHFHSFPTFIACSATIKNPLEHAESICGTKMNLVDNDGAGRGVRNYLLVDSKKVTAASSSTQVGALILDICTSHGLQTISFVNQRKQTEMQVKFTRELTENRNLVPSQTIVAYRGGYLPEDRKKIECDLRSGVISGVSTTCALEAGLDVGNLDVSIVCGWPGSMSSIHQRFGRAGRRGRESLCIYVAEDNPTDFYILNNPDFIKTGSPECAFIDPQNPYILSSHLRCAIAELQLSKNELDIFGKEADVITDNILRKGEIYRQGDGFYWNSGKSPWSEVNIRNSSTEIFTILLSGSEQNESKTLGNVDSFGAISQLHPGAVYLHYNETYLVKNLDLRGKIVEVVRKDVDYYTQSFRSQILSDFECLDCAEKSWGQVQFGKIKISTSIQMFKKLRFDNNENIGFESLKLPETNLLTNGFIISLSIDTVSRISVGFEFDGILKSFINALSILLPFHLMCDKSDIEMFTTTTRGTSIVFYDTAPGGVGLCKKIYDEFYKIIADVREHITTCKCEYGCPMCIGSLEQGSNNLKKGVLLLIEEMSQNRDLNINPVYLMSEIQEVMTE